MPSERIARVRSVLSAVCRPPPAQCCSRRGLTHIDAAVEPWEDEQITQQGGGQPVKGAEARAAGARAGQDVGVAVAIKVLGRDANTAREAAKGKEALQD